MVRDAAGRYAIGAEIASGGMATVHLGRMVGAGGFARIVAIKRMHARYAKDPEFVSMFLDEARLAARAPHPNVVSALDVVASDDEIILVMEYVRGASLASLLRAAADAGEEIPLAIALGILGGILSGLHAAHEATTERGEPLGIVHRDVSPQNVLVGVDGVARVLDFGIAKAKYRLHSTKDGRLKGKLRYMAPEQLRRDDVDRRSDVYAASVVLWEVLTGRPLFAGDETAGLIERIRAGEIPSPRTLRPSLPDAVERVVMRGLADEPDDRLPTALAMAEALEGAGAAASAREIGAWVHDKARDVLERHAAMIRALSDGEPSPTSTRTSRPKADSRLETELVVREKGDARLVFDDAGHEAAPLPSAASAAPPRQRRRAVVAVSATLAAVALTTCALVTSSARSTASAPDPEPLPTASASAPSASSLAASASSPDAGSASAEPPVAAPRSSATPPSRRPRLAKPARPGCDPPYFIDSEGHKQYHPKCL